MSQEIKVYYITNMPSEAGSEFVSKEDYDSVSDMAAGNICNYCFNEMDKNADIQTVRKSDLTAAQAEIARLKERLLDFEGMTFSENQEIAELKELIKREVVPDIKDAEIARLQSALDVAVEGLEYYEVGRCLHITGDVNTSIAKSALDKIKQIRGE